MAFSTRYTQAQLVEAVATSENIRQVCLALGLRGRGANYETIRRHISHLGLDTSHFEKAQREEIAVQGRLIDERVRLGRTEFLFTREQLEVAVAKNRSIAAIARQLGLPTKGGATYTRIYKLIDAFQLDTSHMKGQGWSRDVSFTARAARPLTEILVKGRPCQSSRLRQRLVEEGLKEARCENCLRESWGDHQIPLELDHLNGDRTDNRIENLRLLCPNCHALTDNYRGRNIGRIDTRPGGEIGSTRRT